MEMTQGWGQCTMIMLTISWRILAAGGVGDAGRAAGVPERLVSPEGALRILV